MPKATLFTSAFSFDKHCEDYDVWAADAFDHIGTHIGIPLHQALALIPNEEVRSYWEDCCPDFGFSVNGAAFIRIGRLNYHSSELIPITYGHPLYESYDYLIECGEAKVWAISIVEGISIDEFNWTAASINIVEEFASTLAEIKGKTEDYRDVLVLLLEKINLSSSDLLDDLREANWHDADIAEITDYAVFKETAIYLELNNLFQIIRQAKDSELRSILDKFFSNTIDRNL